MSSSVAQATAILERDRAALLPRLERWVRQGSFSSDLAGVRRMADLLEEDFALPGLTVERHRGDGVGDHLVWRTPAWAASTRRIVLIGHHDTVFPPGTFERFDLEGDRLRGPGVLDMKGGLLVVRAALAALAELGVLAELPIAVVSVGDEEIGSRHSRHLLEGLARGARAALVFESGRMGDLVVTRRKGTGSLTVKVTGKAAHAGNNHADGINAIWAAARLIDALQKMTDPARHITVNVGTIKGGETTNTVPAACVCGVDFRYVRAVDGDDLLREIDRAARAIGEETGASFQIEGGVHRPPLERTAASAELYALYAGGARAAGLGDGEAGLIGGGSDANNVSALGVAAIDGLGPRGTGFHTHDEWIDVTTLVPKARALVALLDALRGTV